MASLASAQTPTTPTPAPAPAAAPATPSTPAAADTPPAAAPAAPTWSVGPMDISGMIDGYYSYNENRPSDAANGQINDLYNFNDKTDQFSLSAAKLSINHDPDPVGAHIDFLYGRTNTLINAPGPNSGGEGNYLEQAFLSLKPAKARGLEMDFGKFVTSAGAEVIESKDDWNYSRGLLFAYAIPYFHFGLRSSIPVTKTWTAGLQVVNGWNNVTKNNGGVTIGLTSGYVKPKYTWNLNYYTGPENANTQKGYRNLIDTTFLTTLPGKFNFLVNYDYGQNHDSLSSGEGDNLSKHWQGVAVGARFQATSKAAFAGRYEYFTDPDGFSTGVHQNVQEFTGTYEYKWIEGLLARLEVRHDWSTEPFFHKGDDVVSVLSDGGAIGGVKGQTTVTAGFVAFFGPKR
jgi:Putative beta-barrel porin-2, OmpL-like. bbp2